MFCHKRPMVRWMRSWLCGGMDRWMVKLRKITELPYYFLPIMNERVISSTLLMWKFKTISETIEVVKNKRKNSIALVMVFLVDQCKFQKDGFAWTPATDFLDPGHHGTGSRHWLALPLHGRDRVHVPFRANPLLSPEISHHDHAKQQQGHGDL